MFSSCLGAITGDQNALSFNRARKVCAILVDGLGAHNLKAAGGHAPFLNQALAKSKPISCGFPTTTVSSITSFATGLSAGAHGLVGYKVFDRQNQRSANLLTGWDNLQNPLEWQPNQTISELAMQRGVATYVIGPAEYEGSGFSKATMRDANYRAAKTISDRAHAARKLLQEKADCLIYLYIPELDQTAHAFGVESSNWLAKLEEVDSAVRALTHNLDRDSAVCLTADHGIVDIPHSSQLYLDEVKLPDSLLLDVGGDPRVNFLYLSDQTDSAIYEVTEKLQNWVGDHALVLTKEKVIQSPLYSNLTSQAIERLPDLMVLATKKVALYHRDFARPKSLKMIGQHGALSPEELAIPLLGWGQFE